MHLPSFLYSTIFWSAASGVVAVLALFLSARVYWREIRERRCATITARLETWRQPGVIEGWMYRLIIVNKGPASAREIQVSDPVSTELGPYPSERLLFPREHPPTLHSDEEYHVEVIAADPIQLGRVTVSWRDGRRENQRATIWLSPQHLGIG